MAFIAQRVTLVLAAIVLLASCATGMDAFRRSGEDDFVQGRQLIDQGRREEGLALVEKAFREDPENREYRAYLVRQRATFVNQLLLDADNARAAQQFDSAESTYRRVIGIDPYNERAKTGLESTRIARRHQTLLAEVERLFKDGKAEEAQARVRTVLTENPGNQQARTLSRQIEDQLQKTREAERGLGAAFKRPLALEFRDANLKSVFEVLSRSSGINFVFDKDVRPDIRISTYLKDTTLEDAIKLILITNQLEKKIVNPRTVLIYPNTPAKAREYQELMVKTFYLANADVKQTMNMVKTLIKTRDVFIDEKLNMLTMKDTPAAIRLAEKLIASQDLAEPEVMIEVEVLEIKRSRLQELGIVWPNQLTILNIVPDPSQTVSTGGATTTTAPQTTTTTTLTLETLKNLRSGSVAVSPNPAVNARAEVNAANLLANPRIRVKNREKAKVHIGEKVPVITTTSTANVGVSESVSYLDIGLKLDVEPNVYLDSEVAIKVGLEVSSVVREITSKTGTLTYQVGTRNAMTTLRLKDGETQALAGLINDEDRRGANRVPGLGDIPVLGRLFSNQRDDRTKTEIVLLMTPHVVRNLPPPDVMSLEYPSGTDAASGRAPLRISPTGSVSIAPRAASGEPAQPEQSEQVEQPQAAPAAPPSPEPQPKAAPAAPPPQPEPAPQRR
ncbi:MAG TPA: secretin N-terminal domain-containing protein [Burkholderiales bacterium]|nr:secretin N-terminal domain-containing protein [Burkholderiales bacterium]